MPNDIWVTEGWIVMADDKPVAGPFATNEAAWRWIDRHEQTDKKFPHSGDRAGRFRQDKRG